MWLQIELYIPVNLNLLQIKENDLLPRKENTL